MSASIAAPRDLLPLPGFPPDSVPFAIRTTIALLLAYGVSFAIQLDSASSAGVCVAIVAQPSPGMALSKAVYRTAGTLLGGVVSLALMAAFPQDRTMLLLCFTLWLGACTFVAALLRDFRSYGAVLCGYTVGIIVLTEIDTPGGALMETLNRVAAIVIGIASVALVNVLLSRPLAFDHLAAELDRHLGDVRRLALDTLGGRVVPGMALRIADGAEILALRTESTYAAVEVAEGQVRRAGAMQAIAGMLAILSACRAIAAAPPGPAARAGLLAAEAALRDGTPLAPPEPAATTADAFFAERARSLLSNYAMAEAGLRLLREGQGEPVPVHIPVHYDTIGAGISAIRTVIATTGGALFCVLSGYPGTTGLLVQQAAFTALLGMQPNPTAAGEAIGVGLIPATAAAWLVGYILLPTVSGFVPFALAVGGLAFVLILAGRLPALQRFSTGFTLYYVLLLSPANQESFDLSGFGNGVLQQVVAVIFMVVAFRFILPVSRKRRLLRLATAIAADLQDTFRRDRGERREHRLLEYDRVAQAMVWGGRRTKARVAVLDRLEAMAVLDGELRRAWSGGTALVQDAVRSGDPDRLDAAAESLLTQPGAAQALSGLYAAARLLRSNGRALRHYGVLR